MTIPKKIAIGGAAVAVLISASLLINNLGNKADSEKNLLKDYQALLKEIDSAKTKANLKKSCNNPQELASKMHDLSNKLADLQTRKNHLLGKEFIPDLPPLPETESSDNDFLSDLPPLPELGRPGSEMPDLSDWGNDLPPLLPLPELGQPGSEMPDLSDYESGYEVPIPDLPPLPKGRPGSIMPDLEDSYWPELPEIDWDAIYPKESSTNDSVEPETTNSEASTDWVPPLPELETNTDPQETVENKVEKSDTMKKIEEIEEKIIQALNNLQSICDEKEPEIISDSCHDACQKYKKCASYGDDISAEDLQDAYDSCFEECQEWSKETIICINKKAIKIPNDCLNLTRCALPEYGGYIPE